MLTASLGPISAKYVLIVFAMSMGLFTGPLSVFKQVMLEPLLHFIT